jgi:hypothetical protein
MPKPAVKRSRLGAEEKARRRTNSLINAVLRAFDGIVLQSSNLRPDQRQAAIDVLGPAVQRVNAALVEPPETEITPSFVLPE